MTLSQLRRQACAMAGYFRPQGPASKASSAAPDQMHDAGLNDRLREDGVDRLGESLQAIDNGEENVADAPVPEFVHDAQPELGAFGVLDPQAENILRAVCLDAQPVNKRTN
jgi:hypothetical protein